MPEKSDIKSKTNWTEVAVISLTDHHNYQVIGQSVAATRSCLVLPDFGIAFDCGYCPESVMLQETIMISHGHADHIAALHRHTFSRQMNRHTEPTYLMPQEITYFYKQAHEAIQRMNHNNFAPTIDHRYQLIPVPTKNLPKSQPESLNKPIYWLPKGKGKMFFVTAYRMTHSIPTVGYCIWEVKKKLKEEFAHLSSREIGKLVTKDKIDVTQIFNIPRVAYTGDTTIHGVLNSPDLLNVETLIMECTYIADGSTDLDDQLSQDQSDNSNSQSNSSEIEHIRDMHEAKERGHIHEDDIIQNLDKFQNKELILFHFSSTYKYSQILEARDRIQVAAGDRLKISVFV